MFCTEDGDTRLILTALWVFVTVKFYCICLLFQFIEWSLAGFGQKLHELSIHEQAYGPFVMSGAGKFQVQICKGKLCAFSKDRAHFITCALNSGCIYKVSQVCDYGSSSRRQMLTQLDCAIFISQPQTCCKEIDI